MLSEQWFDECGNFYEGFAKVKLNGWWNYINQEGGFLSEQWFDYAHSFNNYGLAQVRIGDKWFRIDTKGNLIKN